MSIIIIIHCYVNIRILMNLDIKSRLELWRYYENIIYISVVPETTTLDAAVNMCILRE